MSTGAQMPAQYPGNSISKAARAKAGGGFESAIEVAITNALNAGLIWADGIEPESSTLWPVNTSTNRIWYVDFDLATDGDGSQLNPYNNLTHFGYFDGVNYQEPTNGFIGGDHIWLKGTALGSKHTNGSFNMNWDCRRESLLGPPENPTVVRSWKGQARAVFDGEYLAPVGIRAEPNTDASSTGLVMLNIEGKRSTTLPFNVGMNVNYSRTVSCYAHHNAAGGGDSSYGGIVVRTNSPDVDHRIYSCEVHDNNTSDGTTVQDSNNIGGINVLSDPSSVSTNVVKVYQNLVYNEDNAIRHKHAYEYDFECYSNVVHDSDSAFFVRNDGVNRLHHNVVYDMNEVLVLDAEGSQSIKDLKVYNNTVARFNSLVSTREPATFDINPFDFYKNIAYAPSQLGPVFVIGAYDNSNYADNVASYDNVIFLQSTTQFFENNNVITSLDQFKSARNDTTTVESDPLFTDAVNNDFTLQSGSPAIALGAGAL